MGAPLWAHLDAEVAVVTVVAMFLSIPGKHTRCGNLCSGAASRGGFTAIVSLPRTSGALRCECPLFRARHTAQAVLVLLRLSFDAFHAREEFGWRLLVGLLSLIVLRGLVETPDNCADNNHDEHDNEGAGDGGYL